MSETAQKIDCENGIAAMSFNNKFPAKSQTWIKLNVGGKV